MKIKVIKTLCLIVRLSFSEEFDIDQQHEH